MAATLVNNNNQINVPSHQPVLLDAQLFSVPDLEDVTDIDGTTAVDNREKGSSKVSVPTRPWSEISTNVSSNRKLKTRTYKFIQLQRALTLANILKSNDDRIQFENDYLKSIRENTFEEFLEIYYQKIREHYEQIKKDEEIKKARIFTFFDLEKNFLALDPTRDVKILFVDEPSSSTITKTTHTRSTLSAHQRSISASAATDASVETFYARRAQQLLNDPSRARHEITLFARRTAERLHERLPRLTTVPHRVKIVDQRDTTGKPEERIYLQLKHKRALSVINKRRDIILKMVSQTKKDQMKMIEQRIETPLAIDNSACCKELLERANQIEEIQKKEIPVRQRPQTAMVIRRLPDNKSSVSTVSDTTKTNSSSISNSIPFQDSLSINQLEKSKNIRILRSTRPLTAPIKVNWVNYC